MTTATIATNASFANIKPAARAPAQDQRRVGLMDLIAAFGEAITATKEYEALVEKGTSPADAARKALLGK